MATCQNLLSSIYERIKCKVVKRLYISGAPLAHSQKTRREMLIYKWRTPWRTISIYLIFEPPMTPDCT